MLHDYNFDLRLLFCEGRYDAIIGGLIEKKKILK